MYAPYSCALSLIARDRMPCLAPAPPIMVPSPLAAAARMAGPWEHVTPFEQQSGQHQVVAQGSAQLRAQAVEAVEERAHARGPGRVGGGALDQRIGSEAQPRLAVLVAQPALRDRDGRGAPAGDGFQR